MRYNTNRSDALTMFYPFRKPSKRRIGQKYLKIAIHSREIQKVNKDDTSGRKEIIKKHHGPTEYNVLRFDHRRPNSVYSFI